MPKAWAGWLLIITLISACAQHDHAASDDQAHKQPDHLALLEESLSSRQQSGDTVALPAAKLAAVIPSEIAGFQLQHEDLDYFSSPGASYSEAVRQFSEDSLKGNRHITISVADNVNSPELIRDQLEAFVNLADSVERPDAQHQEAVWVVHYPQQRQWVLKAVIGYRYIISIIAIGDEDAALLKQIYAEMNISALAEAG